MACLPPLGRMKSHGPPLAREPPGARRKSAVPRPAFPFVEHQQRNTTPNESVVPAVHYKVIFRDAGRTRCTKNSIGVTKNRR